MSKVAEKLGNLRQNLAGCKLVALGDLSSRIVLCVSSDQKHPQERMDALCATAGDLLDGSFASHVNVALGRQDGEVLGQAIVLSATDAKYFIRSPDDASEVLCCAGSSRVYNEKATQAGRALLHQISVSE